MRYLSVFNNDGEILTAFSEIFLKGKWFDLDCTYSKGVFYEKIEPPKNKSDLIPYFLDVEIGNGTPKQRAYKECIEKVKSYFRETRFAYDADNLCEELDNLSKELVGEDK